MRAWLLLLALTGCAHVGPPRTFDAAPALLSRRSAPILLVHGILLVGSSVKLGLTSFDRKIIDALERDGFDVFLPALPAIAPPAERAEYLLRAIDEVRRRTGAARVHVVAHSQAGVDIRLLLDDPRATGKVASVVTLSTPHHGTPLADVMLELHGSLGESFLDRVALRIDASRGWPKREGRLFATAAALTPGAMAVFDAHHPGSPVPLYSLAATPELARDGACDGGLWPAPTKKGHRSLVMSIAGMILDQHTPNDAHLNNDGIVPTASERWGTFLGCVPIDHAAWLHVARGGVDIRRLLLELARGLRDVERTGADAMNAHAPALARIVNE
ncbi:MAG: alpha/beta fold hydrolase [Polyangia bacterium]